MGLGWAAGIPPTPPLCRHKPGRYGIGPYMGCAAARGLRLAAGLPRSVGAGFIPPAGVCATAGCGGVRAPRPTNARVVETVRFGRSFRKVCRGGIHPARNPRAAANTRGRAMALPYQPQAGARQNFCAAPKIRTEQAPLSKGARAEIGGLPPGKLPPPGAPPKRALPAANGISRRSNPSVLAALGHLPLTREANPAAVRFPARYNLFRRGVTAALPPAGWRGWFRARRRWRAASAGRRTAASARRARPSPA